MPTVLELREERAKCISDARVLLDKAEGEERDLSSEELEPYNKLHDRAKELQVRYERQETQERSERELAAVQGNGDEGRSLLPGDSPEDGDAGRQALEQRAYRSFLMHGRAGMPEEELRALQADSDVAGGFLLPRDTATALIQAIDDLIFFRGNATVVQVTNADSLGVMSLDTDPSDADWTHEIGTGDEDTAMAFGGRELKPHPLAKQIKVSRTLLRKAPNVEALVRERMARKQAVPQENAFLNGSGAGQPLGVFTASVNGISTDRDVSDGNSNSSPKFDGLKSAKWTLKSQYWAKARWIFHRDSGQKLDKLKDGQGQYIWVPSVVLGQPDRLLNFPVDFSEYAPNTFTTGKYVGVLGDFSKYWIADSLAIGVQRLDELHALTNQVGFITRSETDGMPMLEEAFVRVKLG